MKQYVQGYYGSDDHHIGTLAKQTNRAILNAIRDAYPSGLNAHEIEEKTGLPLKTIYPSLNELDNESFIYQLDKQHNPPGRPPAKAAQGSAEARTRSRYAIEDVSRIYDIFYTDYPLAPGNVDYPDEFVDAWHIIVQKEEEHELCTTLLHFLQKMVTRISESENNKVKKIAPEKKAEFCCSQCGINHEVRDFMRAMLLHLTDHLEKSNEYIEFMKNNKYLNQELYEQFKEKIRKEKERHVP